MGRGGRGSGGGGGGRRPLSSSFDRELRGHIESCKNNYLSVEDLVNHLRSSYHKYSREKLLPFTRRVQEVLQTSYPNSTEEVTPPSKKPKRDSSEQRLQLLEKKHIMNNSQRNKQERGDGSSSTTLASTSESDDSYCSSSFDSIYEEKLEEKPDLMKSMLGHTYNQQVNNTPNSKKFEYEVVRENNDEKRKKLDMSKGGGQRRKGTNKDLGGGGGEGEKFGDTHVMVIE